MCQVKNGQKKKMPEVGKKNMFHPANILFGTLFQPLVDSVGCLDHFRFHPGDSQKATFSTSQPIPSEGCRILWKAPKKKVPPPPPRFLRRLELKCFFFILKPLEHIGFKCPPLKKGNHLIAGFSGLPS